MAAQVQGLCDSLLKDFKEYVHDDSHAISRLLGTLEKKLHVKREYVIFFNLSLIAIYLIFGNCAALLCNFVGFAYPAYMSMKAIETKDMSDDIQWLTYWSVFAVFSMVDTISDEIMGWFPIYWLAKFVFLLWLSLPETKGAQKMYKMFLEPFMTKYSAKIDSVGNKVAEDLKRIVNEVRKEIESLREKVDSVALQNSANTANVQKRPSNEGPEETKLYHQNNAAPITEKRTSVVQAVSPSVVAKPSEPAHPVDTVPYNDGHGLNEHVHPVANATPSEKPNQPTTTHGHVSPAYTDIPYKSDPDSDNALKKLQGVVKMVENQDKRVSFAQ